MPKYYTTIKELIKEAIFPVSLIEGKITYSYSVSPVQSKQIVSLA